MIRRTRGVVAIPAAALATAASICYYDPPPENESALASYAGAPSGNGYNPPVPVDVPGNSYDRESKRSETPLLDVAHKNSIRFTTAAKVTYLVDTLGPRVTAAALGLSDARPLKRWASGTLDGPRSEITEDRLRILYQVVYAVAEAYGPAAASGFIRGANPNLNDDAILLLLRGDDVLDHEKRIIAATRSFLDE